MDPPPAKDAFAPSSLPHHASNGNPQASTLPEQEHDGKAVEVEPFRARIQQITSRVNELEHRVNEVSQFYSSNQLQQQQASKGINSAGKEKERLVGSAHKKHSDATRKDGPCTKRMQELMRQFGTILRQISQDKNAWPFMEPVDVEGLHLHDYYEIIKKPMDFGTIRTKMEVKDGTGYKNVREICDDVRLVFSNAMEYNDESHDIHDMAKKLLQKFEEKWNQLLPKVIDEETRQKEEAKAHIDMQISKEATITKIAKDTNCELNELNLHLEELREMVVKKCRKISTEEKRRILCCFSKLPLEQINRALQMIGQHNANFPTPEVLIDMDAQTESTLWRLKSHINASMKVETKNSPVKSQDHVKRSRVVSDASVKNAKKRIKRP